MRSLDEQKTQMLVMASPRHPFAIVARSSSARTISSTISSMSSVTCMSSTSAGAIVPADTSVVRTQSSSPFQYNERYKITGNEVTLRVCTNVSDSKSSSSVPKPPGNTTNDWAYFTNIVLRAKKYLNCNPMSTQSLSFCSNGSSMPSPTETPPASLVPLLTASIMPGPPPVMTANPARASAPPSCSAAA